MALTIAETRSGLGAISLKLTKQGSDSDFLGFEFWETDDQYAVSEEVFGDRVQDVTLLDYTFHFNKSPGTYYFNGYAIDFARNRSAPVNLTIEIIRSMNQIFPLDPALDRPRIGYLWSGFTFFTRTVKEGASSLHVNWLGTLEDMT